ncbi:MAG TPA: transcriptional regulator PpsR, partial [Casimicrobiaceae bacterium]
MKQFDAPARTLGGLDAEAAASLITAASDVALIIDREGVIRDIAFGSDELSAEGYGKWIGQAWIDTVTTESRPKVEAILRDAAAHQPPKGRHVNHPSSRGADVPVLYSAVPVGREDRIVVIGRDLRAVAALQQRLVEAQQSMERDYWRLRQVETRYRLLFQMASEAVLILDAGNEKVIEANPAAGELFGEASTRLVGRAVAACFDGESFAAVAAMLSTVRSIGRADEIRVRLPGDAREYLVSATLFRQEAASFFLVRISPLQPAGERGARTRANLLRIVENAPDGFVATDPEGRILAANAAFLELAQLASEAQARGESLERWFGRPGVDLDVLIANLRQHGVVRLFATTLRGEHGTTAEVEISA